jgi:U6 snRNA-associated Sm-like protein LSm1
LGNFQDPAKEGSISLRQLPVELVAISQKEEHEARARMDRLKNKVLHDRGFSVDPVEADLY